MKLVKLSATALSICMIACAFSACANTVPETFSAVETTTTATTAEPTPTPTPTPEPTATPTPTPTPSPIEEYVIDDDLIGTWTSDSGNNVVVIYTFNEDNTGVLYQSFPSYDAATMEESVREYETPFEYTILRNRIIRIVTGEDRYLDYEYHIDDDELWVADIDHYSGSVFYR